MTNATPLNDRSNYNRALPNVQTPAIAEIWDAAAAAAAAGLARGFERQVAACVAATAAHNHCRRAELPGDPAEQLLTAHLAGIEAARHLAAKEGVA